jgi:hypothetical protein
VTATVTELPIPGLIPYVIHHRAMDGEESTVYRAASSISGARNASGLPSPVVVHPAKGAHCDTCARALTGGAVSGS